MRTIYGFKGFLSLCFRQFIGIILLIFIFSSCTHLNQKEKSGNVIFFHPDGMSLAHWDAIRLVTVGPDGLSPWDQLPHMAVYKGHLKTNLTASSHAGATIHAYGLKVGYNSFGNDEGNPLSRPSLLVEAKQKGFQTGLCQTGILTEPGTAVFASKAKDRKNFDSIAEQLIDGDIPLLMGGGEKFLLPEGVAGYFGMGARKDGKNLIQKAKANGYHVIYTREELRNIPKDVKKVLGVFAYENTYNDQTEEDLKEQGLTSYEKAAPTIGEMIRYSLKFFERQNKRFFLVAEEEGTDNFSNKNNATGFFEAGKRALEGVHILRELLKTRKDTLLIVASDSNASGLTLVDRFSSKELFSPEKTISNQSDNQAPVDRTEQGTPFLTAPDRKGHRLPFAVVWPTKTDTGGGILVKSEGLNSHKIKGTLDNTELYRIMRETLGMSKANK